MCPLISRHGLTMVFGVVMLAYSVLVSQVNASCSVADFRPYWRSTFEVFLTDLLSREGISPLDIVPEHFMVRASLRNFQAQQEFISLLEDYPALCRLKRMKLNPQSGELFALLILQQAPLRQALENRQISAKYLADTAVTNPVFISNLLGHLVLLAELTHTLEVSKEQQQYFTRLITALASTSKVSEETQLVFSRGFSHMVLLINEGQDDALLDKYSGTVSHLKEDQFGRFLQLSLNSTAGIETFLLETDQTQCQLIRYGKHHEFKLESCGNTVIHMTYNGSSY